MENQLQDQALEGLLRRAYPYASFLCRKLLPDCAEAVTRQVLEIICRQHQALENPAAFLGWVNRITARLCVLAMKNSGHVFAFDGFWGPEPEEACSPAGELNSRELAMQMEQRADALPLNLRVCVYLHDYAQLTVREAARLMQVSEGEVCFALEEAAARLGTLSVEDGTRSRYTVSPAPYLGFYLRSRAEDTADAYAASCLIQSILNPEAPEEPVPPPEQEPDDRAEEHDTPEKPKPKKRKKRKKSKLVPILFAIFAVLCAICAGLAAAVAVHG